jgi:hypothetical protein
VQSNAELLQPCLIGIGLGSSQSVVQMGDVKLAIAAHGFFQVHHRVEQGNAVGPARNGQHQVGILPGSRRPRRGEPPLEVAALRSLFAFLRAWHREAVE